MKKILYPILAVAAIASCAKTEPVYMADNSEIKMQPATTVATKAVIPGTTYPTTESFDVYAFWAKDWATDTATPYLAGEGSGVEFVNKGAYWGGKTTYYWPKSGSLKFACYSPATEDLAYDLATDTYSKTDYTQSASTAQTCDLLLASATTPYTAMTAAQSVAVKFEHALSWITLEVKAKDSAVAGAINVKKVTINDVMTKADLSAAMSEGVKLEAWSNHSDAKPYVVFEGSQPLTVDAAVVETVANGTVVIPQETTTVTIEFAQGALEGQSVTLDLLHNSEAVAWEPGKHYIYTFVFSLDEINITPSVKDWEDTPAVENEAVNVIDVKTPAQLASAVAMGGKVVLQDNIEVASTLVVEKDLVLELNGKTLTNNVANAATDVIVVGKDAILTINGEGTVEAVSGNDGYPVIADGIVVINGGTFKSGVDANNKPNAVIYARGNGEIYVNGGNFPNANNSGFVLNKKDADRATTIIEVTGGTFTGFNPADNAAENPGTDFLAEGYVSYELEEGEWTVVPANTVIEVAAAQAITAVAAQGGKAVLVSDVTLAESLAVEGNLTVDLNGKTLSSPQDVFDVTGTLVINGEGKVEATTKDSPWCAVFAHDNAMVTINGGEFKVAAADGDYNDLIYAKDNAVITINGGKFHAAGATRADGVAFVLNIKDTTPDAKIIVNGGEFENFNPSAPKTEIASWYAANPNGFLAEGYVAVNNGGWYSVEAAEVVTLAADKVLTETWVISENTVINLNGKTITNSVDNATTDVIVVEAGATLVINGEGTVEAVTGNDGYAVIADGVVVINGGTFKSGVDADGLPNAVVYARGKGEVYVNGGNFPNENNSGFVLNKKDADRATTVIEVSGGSFFNFNPADNAAENPGTNFLAAGKTVTESDGWYIVK